MSTDTLSGYLRDHLTDMESDQERELPPGELREQEEAEKLAEAIVGYVLLSRETLTLTGESALQKFEEVIREAPELVISFLDAHYTRKMLAEIPTYVRRTLELSQMEAEGTPSEITNTYSTRGGAHVCSRFATGMRCPQSRGARTEPKGRSRTPSQRCIPHVSRINRRSGEVQRP